MKNFESFLFEKITIPNINTFIILDIIIKILKSRKNKKTKIKKVLYLTNKTLTDIFPPDFNFILDFLNSPLDDKIWNIQKIKNYKKLVNKEKNYFDLKINTKMDIEQLKNLLKYIHIKYIDKEIYLMKLLYKLNEHKKYNLIVINLAFFFVKDENKIKIFLECISSEQKIKENVNKSLNNTNDFIIINKNQSNVHIENEICDQIFFKNILNTYFHYSFFINFFEYLNRLDDFSFLFNSLEEKEKIEHWKETLKKGLKKDINSCEEEMINTRKTKRRKRNSSEKSSKVKRNKNISNEEYSDKKMEIKNEEKHEYNDSTHNTNNYHKNYINSLNNQFHNSIKASSDNLEHDDEHSLKYVSDNSLKYNSNKSSKDNYINSLTCSPDDSLKQKKKLKNNLYIFDMIPNSEIYKKMYFNILSLNFNYTYLISCNF